MLYHQNHKTTPLKWEFEKETISLHNHKETVLKIHITQNGHKGEFNYQNKTYYLSHEGFWNPSLIIKNNQFETMLRSKSNFWSTNTIYQLSSGNTYTSRIHNNCLAQLEYKKMDGTKLFSFQLLGSGQKVNHYFQLYSTPVETLDLILLLASGAFYFKNLCAENGLELLLMVA
jgi:hypothetical protein